MYVCVYVYVCPCACYMHVVYTCYIHVVYMLHACIHTNMVVFLVLSGEPSEAVEKSQRFKVSGH